MTEERHWCPAPSNFDLLEKQLRHFQSHRSNYSRMLKLLQFSIYLAMLLLPTTANAQGMDGNTALFILMTNAIAQRS